MLRTAVAFAALGLSLGQHHHGPVCHNYTGAKIANRNPVVLIPPLTGSDLDSKLTNSKGPSFLCKRDHPWKEFWPPAPQDAFGPLSECWAFDASLTYAAARRAAAACPACAVSQRGPSPLGCC